MPKVHITGGGTSPLTATSNDDGTFEFTAATDGKWVLLVRPESAPAGYYLASIRLGNSDALAPGLPILSGAEPLTFTYKPGGGTVRGTIASCNGGAVTLAPRDPAIRNPSLVCQAVCDAAGKFEILSVRPGEYYAFALPADDYFSPIDELDSGIVERSTLVTVVDKETVTPQVHLIER